MWRVNRLINHDESFIITEQRDTIPKIQKTFDETTHMPGLILDNNQANYQIRSYQPGEIKINSQILTTSVIVTPVKLIKNWQPQTCTELTPDSFSVLIEMKPDIVIIGTGSEMVFLDPELYGTLINHGIGVEFMDTRSACRTYNALSSENRDVAAALVIR